MAQRYLMPAALGVLLGAMIVFPRPAAAAARDALSAWAQAVVPSLGPFMACVQLLSPHLGSSMGARTALSWLGGSPGGARLMQEDGLSGRGALHAAALTGTMSPMFFLGTLAGWLGNARAGWLLLGCHWLGAFLAGRCFPPARPAGKSRPAAQATRGISQVLRETAAALGMIGVCMMLGAVAARMAACALPFLPPQGIAALQCLLEITAGARALLALSPAAPLPVLCAACAFGGLSVQLQNLAFWQRSGLTLSKLVLVRAVHALIAGGLCFLACAMP